MWNGSFQEITMTLVEGQGSQVIHGSFQPHASASDSAKLIFRSSQQTRTDPETPASSSDIDGDDVTHPTAVNFSNNETDNSWALSSALGIR